MASGLRWVEVVPVAPDRAAHSVTLLLAHVVWSTRRRWRAIEEALDEPLHRSMKSTASELRVALHAFGAAPDHVHILVQLPGDMSIATLVQRLKGASSHEFGRELLAGWQAGYWAESVSLEATHRVAGYLHAQRAHHASGMRGEPGGIVGPQMEPAFRRA